MNPGSSAPGRVTTFYSYKGGTGRSMLLANVAWALAMSGRRVLMVDWDLEAPGLHRYFAPFLVDPELTASDGLIDLLIEYASAAITPSENRSADWYLEYADVLKYSVSINWDFPEGGSLRPVPAGRQGPTYATRTNTFLWKRFYEELGGSGFVDILKTHMCDKFTEVLVDSRTGVSDTSGICTVQMPDQLVACFTLNNQSIEGTAAVTRSVLAQQPQDFKVYPVATRIDNNEADRLRNRWALARSRFAEIERKISGSDGARYWDTAQILYIPKFSYEEVLADLANRPDDPKPINLFASVQGITREIFGVDALPIRIPDELRESLLRGYSNVDAKTEAIEAATRFRVAENRIESKLREEVAAQAEKAAALRQELQNKRAQGGPHAFVIVPFGTKPGADGKPIDFNRVYDQFIAPALEAAGLESIRTDEALRPGDIRTDMFQELVIADLVVADVSIENANVWYQLGVRHTIRSRGVVIVEGGQIPTAFDLYTDRRLRYGLKDGGPDPQTVEDDKRKLTEMIKATMGSWGGRKVSPVYHLMPNLQEPDWKSLRIGDVREFWEKHDRWENRIGLARRAGLIGDVLVLAEEAPVAAFRADAWINAGEALRKAEHFKFALEQLEKGLDIEPHSVKGLREKGICLQRLALAAEPGHSLERNREHYGAALREYPTDPEMWSLLGRADKDAWVAAWRRPWSTPDQMRDDAAYEDALLRAAIDSYAHGFRADPGHYYSGINALTLMHLARHLTQDKRYDNDIDPMAGAVRYAAKGEPDPKQYYWSYTTLADLEVLVGTPQTVTDAYKEAIAKNERDWFALNSSRAQLQLLQDLGFRPETVAAGIIIFDRAISRLSKAEDRWAPRQVLLFSGHRMDTPDRKPPRFPPAKEAAATEAIEGALDRLGAGAGDLSFCQAAAGGDLLFLEACQQRGVRCRVLLPFDEAQFIEKSVAPSAGGDKWRDRFYAMKGKLTDPIRIMPDELGPAPANADSFERCNVWSLYSALACGIDKVRFVALWDGGGGDGPGDTAHVYNEIKQRTGRVTWLDVRTL